MHDGRRSDGCLRPCAAGGGFGFRFARAHMWLPMTLVRLAAAGPPIRQSDPATADMLMIAEPSVQLETFVHVADVAAM